jgi:hypothetical protein
MEDKEMRPIDWKLFISGLVIGFGAFVILAVISYQYLTYKDPHIECNKGNHKWEDNRCKNCGLLN